MSAHQPEKPLEHLILERMIKESIGSSRDTKTHELEMAFLEDVLKNKKFDPNAEITMQEDGKTLTRSFLLRAIATNDIKAVQLLLKYGANPYFFPSMGESPLMYARGYGFFAIIAELKNAEKIWAEQNPKEYSEFKHFYESALEVKESGHVLGFEVMKYLQKPLGKENEVIIVDSNGVFSSFISVSWVTSALKEYMKSLTEEKEKKHFERILKIFEREQEVLDSGWKSADDFQSLIDIYEGKKGKPDPILISTGSRSHAITVLLYKGQLVLCNRGAGKQLGKAGTLMYDLKPGAKNLRNPTQEIITKDLPEI